MRHGPGNYKFEETGLTVGYFVPLSKVLSGLSVGPNCDKTSKTIEKGESRFRIREFVLIYRINCKVVSFGEELSIMFVM